MGCIPVVQDRGAAPPRMRQAPGIGRLQTLAVEFDKSSALSDVNSDQLCLNVASPSLSGADVVCNAPAVSSQPSVFYVL